MKWKLKKKKIIIIKKINNSSNNSNSSNNKVNFLDKTIYNILSNQKKILKDNQIFKKLKFKNKKILFN